MKIRFPKLTAYQQEVYDYLGDCYRTGKVAVLKSCRQSGKSFFCLGMLAKMGFEHAGTISAIFEPTLNQARVQYKQFSKFFNGSNLIKSANATLLEIELVNGSQILFKSTEQSSRGFTVSGILILDECAYLDENEIMTILPLVNAYNAPIIIASTPFTQSGYYYEMYCMGLSGENEGVRSFDWSKHPEIKRFLTDERKAFYKRTMTRQKYRTEVDGDFLTDEGLLFINIDNCIGEAGDNNIIFVGIDFGTGSDEDYTVLSVMNGIGEQVCLYRNNHMSPKEQIEWIARHIQDLAERYTIRSVLGEINSIGKVYVDLLNARLKHMKLKVTDWVTTNKSKQDLVTLFQIALENEEVSIVNNWTLLDELRKYEAEVNEKTKTVSYNGHGAHDDTVIATMLSYWAYKKNYGRNEARASVTPQTNNLRNKI